MDGVERRVHGGVEGQTAVQLVRHAVDVGADVRPPTGGETRSGTGPDGPGREDEERKTKETGRQRPRTTGRADMARVRMRKKREEILTVFVSDHHHSSKGTTTLWIQHLEMIF